MHNFAPDLRKDARVVEEARLESVYTPKAYRGFESPSFRKKKDFEKTLKVFFVFFIMQQQILVHSPQFPTNADPQQTVLRTTFVQRLCTDSTKAL